MDETTLKRLFVIALQFENSFGILANIAISKADRHAKSLAVTATSPAIPSIVCGAFALELLLKCLIALETNAEPPKSHNLRRLFDLTSVSSQAAIRKTYSQLLQDTPEWIAQYSEAGISVDFDNVLNACKDAFVEWRYHYENEKAKSWLASPIMKSVRDEILKHRSDWVLLFEG